MLQKGADFSVALNAFSKSVAASRRTDVGLALLLMTAALTVSTSVSWELRAVGEESTLRNLGVWGFEVSILALLTLLA